MSHPGRSILTVVWIGSLWTIGYIVVPTLFSMLDDQRLAGLLAGRLFTIGSYLRLACGGVLLLIEILGRPAGSRLTWRTGLLLTMLGIIAIGEFVLQPMMAELKSQDMAEGADFALLHALASLLYMINSLLGLGWVVFADR